LRPEVNEGVKLRDLIRQHVAIDDGQEEDKNKLEAFLQKTLMFATVELWCHPRLRNHCKEYYKKNAILETKPT
jgi:hypothetical protein